jgi:hypothetical protein
MTYQQIIEAILEEHPGVLETEVKIEVNKTLREFCRRTNILSDNTEITVEDGVVTYELPDDADRVYRVDFKNSNDLLVGETEKLKYSIEQGYIKFYGYMWREITAIPSNISVIKLYYYKRPAALSTDTDIPEVDSEFHTVIADKVSARYYRREKDFDTYVTLMREWEKALKEAKIAANEDKDATLWNIKQQEY